MSETRRAAATPAQPSLEVVERIAAREGTSPLDLSPPLYTAIDPDALDSLFQSTAAAGAERTGRVSFTYCGYAVEVRSDGDVTIDPA